jgi:hypothetical protein
VGDAVTLGPLVVFNPGAGDHEKLTHAGSPPAVKATEPIPQYEVGPPAVIDSGGGGVKL